MEKYIDAAVEQFRTLLTQQIERSEKMANDTEKVDFASLPQIKIGVVGGDGIGPIITAEAEELLRYLLKDEVESGKVLIENIEGLTIENRLEKNQAVPSDVLKKIKSCHVLLKGPTEAKWKVRMLPYGASLTSTQT